MKSYEYHDGDEIRQEHAELKAFMSGASLIHDETGKASFSGVLNIGEERFFFWPKCFSAQSAGALFKSGRLLLDCIRKYALNRGSLLSLAGSNEEEPVGLPPLVAIEVLQDYMRYGLYSNSTPEVKRRNTGKIFWNKVLKSSLPFVRRDGRPVYTDLYVSKTNYFSDNEVTQIHAEVTARLDKVFGWYFTGSDRGVATDLKDEKLAYSPEKAIAIVKRELALVFSDREIRLLKNLVRLLEEEDISAREDSFFCGITNFAHVWEDICSVIYQNEVSQFSAQIPFPAYVFEDGLKTSEKNKQRMDVLIQDKDTSRIAIMDAKYYDFSKNKPSWGDLVKQFYYKRSLAAVTEGQTILNFLLVPAPKEEGLPESAVIVTAGEVRLDNEFDPIKIIYLDVQNVMEQYVSAEEGNRLRQDIFSFFPAQSVAA